MKPVKVILPVLAVCVTSFGIIHYMRSGKSDTPQTGVGGRRGGTGGGKLEYPVDVAKLEQRQMQYSVTAPGTIDAFQQVQITARVAGAVDKVTFVEGQQVKQGDVLATIESDRYAIAVEQARAGLAKADSAQKSAQAALDRRLAAQKESPGLVPGEEIEQKQTAVETAKADVLSAQEALKVAALNLRDSQVRAPIGGVVQTRTVQQGQYLQPGAVLATILQRDPMLARFQVTEQDAPRLKPDMQVNLQLKESPRTFTAKITLVAGTADATTRMVPVTAQIDTTDHQYWLRPGAFCEVSVPVGNARPGIVVPGLAVQPTEKGNIVYIVDDQHIAHARVVEIGMHTPDGGIELTRGVNAGEMMVVRGIDPLSDGAPVKVGATLSLEDAQKAAAAPAQQGDSGAGSGSGSETGSDSGSGTGTGTGSGSGHHHRGSAAQ
jgi:RND family efflux transporter MFP subunit